MEQHPRRRRWGSCSGGYNEGGLAKLALASDPEVGSCATLGLALGGTLCQTRTIKVHHLLAAVPRPPELVIISTSPNPAPAYRVPARQRSPSCVCVCVCVCICVRVSVCPLFFALACSALFSSRRVSWSPPAPNAHAHTHPDIHTLSHTHTPPLEPCRPLSLFLHSLSPIICTCIHTYIHLPSAVVPDQHSSDARRRSLHTLLHSLLHCSHTRLTAARLACTAPRLIGQRRHAPRAPRLSNSPRLE